MQSLLVRSLPGTVALNRRSTPIRTTPHQTMPQRAMPQRAMPQRATPAQPAATQAASCGRGAQPGQFAAGSRHPFWKDVPDALWEDWRWQRQHAVRTTAQLAELLPLPPAEITALTALESKYRTAIPPYYFSLIDTLDPDDPIRLQAVPSSREDANLSGVEFDDPLEEDKDSPVPGVTHRYPDRALLITTPVCSMYCRFCTRKRVTMDREGWDAPSRDEERMIEYVRNTPAIRDVIVSGGDPLTLPVAKLRWFVTRAGRDRPCQRDSHRHPRARHAAAAAVRLGIGRSVGRGREDLDSNPFQSSAGDHSRGDAGLPQSGECRNAGQQPRRADEGSERLGRDDARIDPRLAANQGSAVLSLPLRPRHGGRPLPHLDLEGNRDHRGAAGMSRASGCRRMSSTACTERARFRSCPTICSPPPTMPSSCGITRG